MADNTQFLYHMGGFHLFERSSEETINDNRRISRIDDEPLHPLQAINLVDCDIYEPLTLPTKAEIQDRGMRDWLAKPFVLLQTSWFALQCVARAIEHLPSRNRDVCVCGHEFRDIHFLVEQTS